MVAIRSVPGDRESGESLSESTWVRRGVLLAHLRASFCALNRQARYEEPLHSCVGFESELGFER